MFHATSTDRSFRSGGRSFRRRGRSSGKHPPPDGRGVQRSRSIAYSRVYVREEVVDMSNHNPQQVILGKGIIQQQREAQENPGQVRRTENEKSQERQPNRRIPSSPYVDQREAKRGSKEGHRSYGRQYQQRSSRIHNQPSEIRRPPPETALLQVARVAAHEEDVEHEVQAQRAEVQEGGAQTPVLSLLPDACEAVE